MRDNQMDEYLFTMEKKAPKEYKTYLELKESGGDHEGEASLFALQWAMNHLMLISNNKRAYQKHQDEQYDKLRKIETDKTFSGADTSSKESFLASIREKLQANQSLQMSYFLDQISKMENTPGEYLYGRIQIFSKRA